LNSLNPKAYPIGVDLGTGSVKLAQLRAADGELLDLMAAAASEIPADCRKDLQRRNEFLAQAIREGLKSNNFQGRQAILCLPAAHTFLQHLRMPRLSPTDLPKALRMELQGKLPYAVDDAVIRHVVAGSVFGDPDGKQEVIVVAVDRGTLESYLSVAAKAKLDVVGINVESCAIVECFARLFRRASDTDRAIMFIDLGSSSTQVVLSHGDRMVFAHNLAQGELQVDKAVASGMGIPVEQARALRWDLQKAGKPGPAEDELYRHIDAHLVGLADEVNQCLHYYESVFRSQPVERAIFVGGGAYDKRLCQTLAQRLNIPAQVGDPLVRVRRMEGAGLQIGLDRREPQPNWAVAVGLSLGAATVAA